MVLCLHWTVRRSEMFEQAGRGWVKLPRFVGHLKLVLPHLAVVLGFTP